MKMPFRFARRVRNLEIKYCPTKKKELGGFNGRSSFSSSSSFTSSSGSQQICPSCVLPIVVAFIFGFTLVQLFVIHRTIVAYKNRSIAFEEVYGPSHNDTKSQGDLLAFSKKFDAAWLPLSHQQPRSQKSSLPSSSSGGAPSSSSSSFSSGGKEWLPSGSYPYRVGRRGNSNHIWEVNCPEVPPKLNGNISINVKKDVSLDELTRHNSQVLPGGKWHPKECSPRYHVAVIIPYRFRWSHLKLLLSVLHPMLRRQQLSYQIFVAEQYGNYTFNKGLLMNAAFLLALNASDAFDCVIFHDVDLLPETDRNIYNCVNSPRHLSVSIDAYGYRLPYSKLVGGVFAISVEHFILVNGYSNLYWGWGAEDDDMAKRLIANQLPINRPRPDLAKYKMLQHGRRQPNQFIKPLIRTARLRFPQDGLTTCHFRLVSSSQAQLLFTHFLVDVGQPSWEIRGEMEMIPPSVSSSSSSSHSSSPSNPSHLHGNNYISHHYSSHSQRRNKQQKRSVSAMSTSTEIVSSSSSSSSPENEKMKMKMNELFMLSGIARDNDNRHRLKWPEKAIAPQHPPTTMSSKDGLSPFSRSQIPYLSSLSSSLSKEDGKIGVMEQMPKTIRNKRDIPLDPDVPVEQEDEEEDDDDEDV